MGRMLSEAHWQRNPPSSAAPAFELFFPLNMKLLVVHMECGAQAWLSGNRHGQCINFVKAQSTYIFGVLQKSRYLRFRIFGSQAGFDLQGPPFGVLSKEPTFNENP